MAIKTKKRGNNLLGKLNIKKLILPLVVVVAVAGVGGYMLAKSQAYIGDSIGVISGFGGYGCNYYTIPPTIRQGSTGECVKALQHGLNLWGVNSGSKKSVPYLPLTVDGVFGSKTTSVVKAYQKSKGLTQDGVVGPNTWTAFLSDCYLTYGGCSPRPDGK